MIYNQNQTNFLSKAKTIYLNILKGNVRIRQLIIALDKPTGVWTLTAFGLWDCIFSFQTFPCCIIKEEVLSRHRFFCVFCGLLVEQDTVLPCVVPCPPRPPAFFFLKHFYTCKKIHNFIGNLGELIWAYLVYVDNITNGQQDKVYKTRTYTRAVCSLTITSSFQLYCLILNAYHNLAFKQSMYFYMVSFDFIVTEFMVKKKKKWSICSS